MSKMPIITLSREFKKNLPAYVFQSLLAIGIFIIILYFLDILTSVVVASLGATVFIVFTMPKRVTAQAKNVIGGHIVGAISGCLLSFLLTSKFIESLPINQRLLLILAAAIAVGLAIFLMIITDTEHPPAAGTALGLVINPWTWQTIFFILASTILLSLAKHLLKPWLKDIIKQDIIIRPYLKKK